MRQWACAAIAPPLDHCRQQGKYTNKLMNKIALNHVNVMQYTISGGDITWPLKMYNAKRNTKKIVKNAKNAKKKQVASKFL